MVKRILSAAAILALAACHAPKAPENTILKRDAFPGGKIEVSTIEVPEPHRVPIILSILPLRHNGADKDLDSKGVDLAEAIAARLASNPHFKLVERHRIQDIYKELELGDVGPVDHKTAVRIGGMLGANVIALGSFSILGGQPVVVMRLVKVETGEVVGGVTERGDEASQLDLLSERAAKSLGDALSQTKPQR